MIEKLGIRNFQKHEKIDLDFDQITTIVGPSDVGKSALVRALQWVCRNHPQGSEFITDGKKEAKVRVVVDSESIVRARSKSENTYSRGKDVYRAFGSSVPDGIQEILRTDDICFQSQHDPAFWFSLPAGEVSRRLNDIVDLGVIDRTLQNIASALRERKTAVKLVQERLEKQKSRRDELSWSVDADRELCSVEQVAAQRAENGRLIVGLRRTVQYAKELIERRQTASMRLQTLDLLVDAAKRWHTVNQQGRRLRFMVDEVDKYQRIKKRGAPDMGSMEKLVEKSKKLKSTIADLKKIIGRINDAYISMVSARTATGKRELELYKATEGNCPICGGELKYDCGSSI